MKTNTRSRKRKTVAFIDMIDYVNERNRLSTCTPQVREGWNSFLSSMLMKAEVYAGFDYLSSGWVPPGQDPGIVRDANGEGLHSYPDETRVRFHYDRLLAQHQIDRHIRNFQPTPKDKEW